MERNNDNDYTRDTSDYEPNFILREPEDKSADEGELRRAIDPLKDQVSKPVDAATKEPLHESIADKETTPTQDQVSKPVDAGAKEPLHESIADKETAPVQDHVSKPVDAGAKEPLHESITDKEKTPVQDRVSEPMDTAAKTAPPKAATGTSRAADRQEAMDLFDEMMRNQAKSTPKRPVFENPSYDDGEDRRGMGTYTDPRANFRSSGTASWQNRRTPVGGPGASDPRKKQSRPVTLSRKGLGLLIAGCLVLSSLFGFGGALFGYNLYDNYAKEEQAKVEQSSSAAKTETAGYTLQSATGSGMSVKEIAGATKNSVVEIRTESVASDTWMQEYVTEGAGSGVIISKDGYIMTNNHVIEGANKIKVTTSDEKEYDAKLIGADENNDVAVLKVDANDLTPATYGNSDELEVGDMAVVIGNPLGELGGTVTAGIISAKDRALSIDGKTLHLLQTDSSVNPGNSGGGLFNDSGQLIGLVVAKSAGSDVEGLGFAIPINTAANVAQQLIDKGYVSGQPSTGMTYQEGSSGGGGFGSFESMFGGESATQVYIYSVNGENAKKAGFKSGDIVLAVDDEEITSFEDLSAIVTSHKVGDKLTFTISRDGEEKKIKLELEEKQVSNSTDQGSEGDQSQGEGSDPSDDSGSEAFPSVPGEGGGSLFDYFFGW